MTEHEIDKYLGNSTGVNREIMEYLLRNPDARPMDVAQKFGVTTKHVCNKKTQLKTRGVPVVRLIKERKKVESNGQGKTVGEVRRFVFQSAIEMRINLAKNQVLNLKISDEDSLIGTLTITEHGIAYKSTYAKVEGKVVGWKRINRLADTDTLIDNAVAELRSKLSGRV